MSATRRTRKAKMRTRFCGASAHAKEENFLVGNRESATIQNANTDTNDTLKAPPVSLITVSIPVQFQINDVMAWAYQNADPTNLLQDLATRAVVHYLAGVDLNDVHVAGAAGSGAELARTDPGRRRRAQAGRENSVCRIAGHPSADESGGAITKKSSARNRRSSPRSSTPQADAIRTNALAEARWRSRPRTWPTRARQQLEVSALARAALFTNQIPAFAAAPSVYRQRAYFQTFADATANARKYILLVTNTQDVVIFNLEDKIREDLLNLNVNEKP